MDAIMYILWVILWIIGLLLVIGAGLSLLFFITGLLGFIRYERRLAAAWNKLAAIHLNGRRPEARRMFSGECRLASDGCADMKRRS
jgi:hypothetical protein